MAMTSAFYCTSLKTGTLLVGWITLVLVLLNVLATAVVQPTVEDDGTGNLTMSMGNKEFDPIYTLYNHDYINYGGAILTIMALVSLLYGTYKSRPVFLIPYLVIYCVTTVLIIPLAIYWFVKGIHIILLLPIILSIPINIYCTCIVWSYYKQLRTTTPITP